jgi:hypothetical protein
VRSLPRGPVSLGRLPAEWRIRSRAGGTAPKTWRCRGLLALGRARFGLGPCIACVGVLLRLSPLSPVGLDRLAV